MIDVQQEELALFAGGDVQVLRAAVRLIQDAQRTAPEPNCGTTQVALALLSAAVDAVVQRT